MYQFCNFLKYVILMPLQTVTASGNKTPLCLLSDLMTFCHNQRPAADASSKKDKPENMVTKLISYTSLNILLWGAFVSFTWIF